MLPNTLQLNLIASLKPSVFLFQKRFNQIKKTEMKCSIQIKSVYARIKNLKDASKKMSKSDAGDWCTLYLTDEKDQIHAVT
jgi:tryptophanyl-tRNA synthetase